MKLNRGRPAAGLNALSATSLSILTNLSQSLKTEYEGTPSDGIFELFADLVQQL
jgi:hypothetical protein